MSYTYLSLCNIILVCTGHNSDICLCWDRLCGLECAVLEMVCVCSASSVSVGWIVQVSANPFALVQRSWSVCLDNLFLLDERDWSCLCCVTRASGLSCPFIFCEVHSPMCGSSAYLLHIYISTVVTSWWVVWPHVVASFVLSDCGLKSPLSDKSIVVLDHYKLSCN